MSGPSSAWKVRPNASGYSRASAKTSAFSMPTRKPEVTSPAQFAEVHSLGAMRLLAPARSDSPGTMGSMREPWSW